MFSKKTLAACLFSICGLTGIVNAQENLIRQSDQDTQVIGWTGGYFYFTVSGLPTDTLSAPWLPNGPTRLSQAGAYDAIPNSGGLTSYRFCVPVHPSYNQLLINVAGPGRFDQDRIRVF